MKTPTLQTIQDAIDGDWTGYTKFTDDKENAARLIAEQEDLTAWALLQPPFWQAVGKTRVWKSMTGESYYDDVAWREAWHRFIDHLADGKTIDEALAAISQRV